jgi:hypothetical protein
LKSLSETIVEEVERKIVSGMTQQRRSYAIARRRLVVENVVANAVSLVLRPDLDGTRRCAVPTAKYKPTRYDRQDYPKRLLSDTLQAMESQGLILRHPYIFRQRATTIEPSSNLVEGISRHNVRLDHVGRAPGAETIWINARTGKLDHRDHTPIKRRVYYDDTDETTFLREQMERINAAANQADFRFDGDRQAPVAMRRMFLLRAETDPHAFNLSGRLFGPWWQGVKSTQRHLITIGGEPIADMDYSGCFLQLLYIKETGGLFTGEPYAVPGLEDFRDGAKDGLLSLLSRSSPMQRLTPELRGLLPEGWTARRLVEAFSAYHPAIAQHFATDIGVELMNTESRIMVELLLRLETMGIEAQCLHDGIQVARSAKSKAVEAMVEVSERLLGVALTVKEKAVKGLDGCQAVAA